MTYDIGFLDRHIAGVHVGDALAYVAVVVVVFIVLRAVRALALRAMKKSADAQKTGVGQLLSNLARSTSSLFLLLIALYCATFAIPLGPRTAAVVGTVIQIVLLLQLGIWSIRIALYFIEGFVRRRPEEDGARLATAMGAITFVTQFVIWVLVVLLILSAMHINITALVAGLGVGGIAVALAAQSILGDLFASLSIVLDQPFAVGHFIVIDDIAGTVEHVGIKSTRIRSLSGELIILSNASLLSARIHNYKHFQERRILFSIGVTYDTAPEKLAAIPGMIREAITAIANTRFDRAHFKGFGDSSLDYEIVYFVQSPDYGLYMDIQQEINLALFQRFAEEGIDFAFPSRTLYVNNLAPKP